MNGFSCLHHMDLLTNNLLGHKVPMTGQIPSRGQPKKVLNTSSIVHARLLEAEDFLRWGSINFTQSDHEFSVEWNNNNLDLDTITDAFKSNGINQKICPSLQEAQSIAESLVNRPNKSADNIEIELGFLSVPSDLHQAILEQWTAKGSQPLSSYAPYAAYMLTVETFFYIARAAGLIPLTTSSWMDLCYLYYLPFCNIFVSSDKLHRRCAPLFKREEQQFIWGPDLNNDLISINKHYNDLPDEIKEKGIMSFACKPPKDPRFLVAEIWDKHLPNWRYSEDKVKTVGQDHFYIIEEINKMNNAAALKLSDVDFDLTDPDSLLIRRPVRKQKGSWRLISSEVFNRLEPT